MNTYAKTPRAPRWSVRTRVGLVGCGYWGEKILRILVDARGVQSVVCTDMSPHSQRRIGSAYPGITIHADPTPLFSDPTVGAVFIATPPVTHASLTIQALAAGKHVFVEKPFAMSGRDARKIADTSRRSNLFVMPDHTYLFDGAVRAMRRLVRAGSLGPSILRIIMERENFGAYQDGADVIWDLAPHDVSIARFLLDGEPLSVSAWAFRTGDGAPATCARIAMCFAGGVDAVVSHDWFSPVKKRRITVVGTNGSLVYDSSTSRSLTLFRNRIRPLAPRSSGVLSSGGSRPVPFPDGEPLALAIRHFLACIAKGTRPEPDADSGAMTVRIIEAMQQSARRAGVSVRIRV